MINSNNEFYVWFAGFFDGEGCICFSHPYSLQVRMAQTIKDDRPSVLLIFQDIQKHFGGKLSYIIPKNPNYSKCVLWSLSKRDKIEKMIHCISPYIKIRKELFQRAKNFYDNKSSRKIFIAEDLKLKFNYKDIAKKYNCSFSTIYNLRRQGRQYFLRRKSNKKP